jgi:hypothetical protein
MFAYSPPGGLDDLAGRPTRTKFLNDWHSFIHKTFETNIQGLGPTPLFFSEVDKAAQSNPVPISWNGFPLSISREVKTSEAAWTAADQLQATTRFTPPGSPPVQTQFRPQDEYCEWFAYSEGGKITRIVFTAEGPEYWIRLARADFAAVLALYKKFVSKDVSDADLRLTIPLQFDGEILPVGSYNPYNKWNTTGGVMHLTHPANTLGAEVNLAAFASIPRRDNTGKRVDDIRRLACCGGFGDPNRSSDPSIGFAVNTTCLPLAAGGAAQDATLADPVALYMDGLQEGTITGPQDEPLDSWFQFVRGKQGRGLMAVLEAPPGSQFGLDEVKVKGVKLERGGQVAEVIDMVLYAKVKPHGGPVPPLAPSVTTCCMPVGTPPQKIKDINLVQPRGLTCGANQTQAFPELVPVHPHAAGAFVAGQAIHPAASPKVSSRLAGN